MRGQQISRTFSKFTRKGTKDSESDEYKPKRTARRTDNTGASCSMQI